MSLELLIKVLRHELVVLEEGEVRGLNAEDETQRYKCGQEPLFSYVFKRIHRPCSSDMIEYHTLNRVRVDWVGDPGQERVDSFGFSSCTRRGSRFAGRRIGLKSL
jgi:hypothetical protein